MVDCHWPGAAGHLAGLYGQLFERIVDIAGFGKLSYVTFLAQAKTCRNTRVQVFPGIVVMSSLYGADWSGMGVTDELERGAIERFLVVPTSRAAGGY